MMAGIESIVLRVLRVRRTDYTYGRYCAKESRSEGVAAQGAGGVFFLSNHASYKLSTKISIPQRTLREHKERRPVTGICLSH
jgi:hypothetical protein